MTWSFQQPQAGSPRFMFVNANLIEGDDRFDDSSLRAATQVTAGNGSNVIRIGSGRDVVTVGDGNNTILTNAGNDSVSAGNGRNQIETGRGNDTVTAGTGGTFDDRRYLQTPSRLRTESHIMRAIVPATVSALVLLTFGL